MSQSSFNQPSVKSSFNQFSFNQPSSVKSYLDQPSSVKSYLDQPFSVKSSFNQPSSVKPNLGQPSSIDRFSSRFQLPNKSDSTSSQVGLNDNQQIIQISLLVCGIILFLGSIFHRARVVTKIIKNKKIILPLIGEITKKNFYKYKYINVVVLSIGILLIFTSMVIDKII